MTSPLLWSLVVLQIAMGGFDMIYHHELTERLPWRRSQSHELKLHGLRNLMYCALFATLGWCELHGAWAVALIGLLAAEVVITLLDFVEEDVSRKLPASERVTHTLLALNYGAILALLLPVLTGWAAQPSALVPVSHGVWSAVATLAALGVAIFGIRDLVASRRVLRFVDTDYGALVGALGARRIVLVTGATGFIGQRLVEALAAARHDVIVLARDPAKAALLPPPFRLVTSLDQIPNEERIDAVVNLAGEPIANAPWTAAKRRKILASRLRITADVVALIGRLNNPPAVLVNGSAIGWYGVRGDETLTETATARPCFSHRLCEAWERAATRAERHGTRVVSLRIGLVLGIEGGMLARMLMPFEFGLGGAIGDGKQWMSWIARDDLIRLIAHAMASDLAGPVNATAPAPATNAAFTAELARAMGRPAWLRLPASLLRLLTGDLAEELLLGGQRVLPDRARASGFVFRHPDLRGALAAILKVPVLSDGRDLARHRMVDQRLLR